MSRNPNYWAYRRGKKWEAGWRDRDGRCQSRRFLTESQALTYARNQAMIALDLIAGVANPQKPIAEVLEEFLTPTPERGADTCDMYRRHLEGFINRMKIRYPMDMTRTKILQWWTIIKQEGIGIEKGANRGRGFNQGGQALNLRILRAFCYFCLANKWVSEIPFGKMTRNPIKIPRNVSAGRSLEGEDLEKYLTIDPRYEVDKHLYRAKSLILGHALRLGQVWAIKKTAFTAPDQLFVPGKKKQDDRTVTLAPEAVAALLEALQVADAQSDRIFTYWDTVEAMRDAVRKQHRRLGLVARAHEGKHTLVTHLRRQGWDFKEISAVTGTSETTLRQVYAHVDKEEANNKLAGFWGAKLKPKLKSEAA